MQRLARYHGNKARWVVDAWTETWLSPDFADWSLTEKLQQVLCPTLVIHGTEDEYGSIRHHKKLQVAYMPQQSRSSCRLLVMCRTEDRICRLQ